MVLAKIFLLVKALTKVVVYTEPRLDTQSLEVFLVLEFLDI